MKAYLFSLCVLLVMVFTLAGLTGAAASLLRCVAHRSATQRRRAAVVARAIGFAAWLALLLTIAWSGAAAAAPLDATSVCRPRCAHEQPR